MDIRLEPEKLEKKSKKEEYALWPLPTYKYVRIPRNSRRTPGEDIKVLLLLMQALSSQDAFSCHPATSKTNNAKEKIYHLERNI